MKSLRIIGILTIVSLLSGFVLSYSYKTLSGRIEENQRRQIRKDIFSIVKEAWKVEECSKGGRALYRVLGRDGYLKAYCLVGEGNGYQGKIKILVALRPDLETLWGIDVIESSETPGLGARIGKKHFKGFFQGLIAIPQIALVKIAPKRHNEVEAISGATISSRAAVRIINKTIKEIRRTLKEWPGLSK